MAPAPRLIHLISSTFWGGREQYALDICRSFADSGWDVTVLSRDAKAVDTPFRHAGLKVRHMPLGGYVDITSILRLTHILRRAKTPPVVHVHNFRDAFIALSARKLSLRRGVRVILTCHRVKPGRDTALRRRILRNLQALIFPSALTRDTFLSTWNPMELPLPAERIHVLHNSVYMPGDLPAPPATGPVVASYMGRIVRGKGLETFISALPALRGLRTRACIAGTGDPDYIDTLKRQADRLEVMDMIDWSINNLDRYAILERTHIGVFPSLQPEAFGLSGAACMDWARPQICTYNGAQCEYLTAGREALMIPPADTEALAEALRRLATDPDLRHSMGQAAKDRFETTLAWPRFARSLAAIYRPA